MALVKIYISYIIINWGKNIFELVGTVLNGWDLLHPRFVSFRDHSGSQSFMLAHRRLPSSGRTTDEK